MCDTCTYLQLNRCPPSNLDADPAVAADVAFETAVNLYLGGLSVGSAVIDATTELVLRARLDRHDPSGS